MPERTEEIFRRASIELVEILRHPDLAECHLAGLWASEISVPLCNCLIYTQWSGLLPGESSMHTQGSPPPSVKCDSLCVFHYLVQGSRLGPSVLAPFSQVLFRMFAVVKVTKKNPKCFILLMGRRFKKKIITVCVFHDILKMFSQVMAVPQSKEVTH